MALEVESQGNLQVGLFT